MKITLISNYIPDQQESMLRFADMLASGLKNLGNKITIWHPPVILGCQKGPPTLKKWLAYLDKYLLAWSSLRQATRDADVIHILDHSNAVYGPWLGSAQWWVTCHDLLAVRSAQGEFAHQRTGLTGRLLQKWILSSLRRAPNIVAVSKSTEDDLHRLAPETSARTQIIWNGLNTSFHRQSQTQMQQGLDETFWKRGLTVPSHFLFHIGGNQWYKNRHGVIDIFREITRHNLLPGLKLVMAGKSPTSQMLQKIEHLNLQADVHWLGEVSGSELETLYNAAEGLLFPSLAEGFGWPIVEALACGCPVITSHRPPMTEISGADTLFINLDSPLKSGAEITAWLMTIDRQNEAKARARCEHSTKFSSEAMIEGYLKAYRVCLQSNE